MNPFQSDNIWKKKARQGKAQQHPLTPQQEWQKQVNSSSLWLGGGVVLLECLGTLAANQLYSPEGLNPGAYAAVLDGVLHLNAACRELVVVSNEVFLGGADYAGDTEAYLRLLARLNRRLAAESTRAVARLPQGHAARFLDRLAMPPDSPPISVLQELFHGSSHV